VRGAEVTIFFLAPSASGYLNQFSFGVFGAHACSARGIEVNFLSARGFSAHGALKSKLFCSL
jgi:hypothetical protein